MIQGMNPAEAFSRLARTARWHRRGLGTVAATVCLFACLAVLTPPAPETRTVVVAASLLPAGSQLAAADLKLVALPVEAVPDQALTQLDEATGRTLTGALTSGSVLTTASLLSGRDGTSPDERLVPFRVPDAATVALLQVGDRISVVGASTDGGVIDLASDVRVAALPAPGASGSLGGESGALVVVAADPETAARLAAAAAQMRLAVVMR